MIGMLQIITYLLCTYLLLKGYEILQLALVSPRTDRAFPILMGFLCFALAIGAAFYFVHAIDAQAEAVSHRTSGAFPQQ